ncbi:MAG: hypothetical protein V4850_36650 [Myxococcota bacterium]
MNDATGLALISMLDGRRLDSFLLDGTPVWRCAQVGDLLDYANRGRRLATLITSEWQKEFVDGGHYVVPDGEALAALLDPPGGEPSGAARTSGPLFLTPAGFRKVLSKTPGPVSTSLRAILEEELLPRIAQHPGVASRRTGDIVVVVSHPPGPGRHPFDQLLERAFESGFVRAAVRTLLGMGSRPTTAEDCWHSLPEIARFAEVSEEAVGMAIRQLGIRGAAAFSRATVGAAPDGSPVLAFVYNDVGVRMILAALRETPTDDAA